MSAWPPPAGNRLPLGLDRPVQLTDKPHDNSIHRERWMLVGGSILRGVHQSGECAGEHCVIHDPSEHHMRCWTMNWRHDRYLMERVCPHGVCHPDPDDVNPDHLHGCDGCCSPGVDCHEIIPRSAWAEGKYVLENTTSLCRLHHQWVDVHPEQAHAMGLHGYSWERLT